MGLARRRLLRWLLLGPAALACGGSPPSARAVDARTVALEIRLLRGTWDSLGLGYDWQAAEPKLRAALDQTAFIIRLDDVGVFDWERQEITLEPNASNRLVRSSSPSISLPTTGDVELTGLDHRAFAVLLNGNFVYGGVVLGAGSPMGIDYPVLHAIAHGERVILRVRPGQAAAASDPRSVGQRLIRHDGLRDALAKAGKLAA